MVLLVGSIALAASMPVTRYASAAPLLWTGTIIESGTANYSQGGVNSLHITVSCHTTITFNADGSADSDSSYTYSRVQDDRPSANYEVKTTTQAGGPGTNHYQGSLSVNISSNSTYQVSYSPEPPFTVTETTTTEATGQQTTTYTTTQPVECFQPAFLHGTLTSQTSANGQGIFFND